MQGRRHDKPLADQRYILILQWSDNGSETSYDDLLAMEDALGGTLPDSVGFVDGHDFGSGEMNIFIDTDAPLAAFDHAVTALGAHRRWADVRAAYRPARGDRYAAIWPETLNDFSVS